MSAPRSPESLPAANALLLVAAASAILLAANVALSPRAGALGGLTGFRVLELGAARGGGARPDS